MIIRILLFFSVLFFNCYYGSVLMAVPQAERLFRVVMFAGDVIMMVMALSVLWRTRTFPVVKYLVLFLFCSTITLFLNLHSVAFTTHLNGLRQPLFFLSSLIVLYDIAQSRRWESFSQMFNSFLFVFAILQIPLSIIQFVKFGAGDMVGGTFGYTGGSGQLSQLAFLITFYFIVRASWYKDPDNVRLRSILLYSLLLIPCTINETKISFIFLAAYVVLLSMSRRKIFKSIPVLAFGVVLILLLNYYYGKTVETTEHLFDGRFLERYLFYDPRENVDVPRFQKLVLMFRFMHGDVLQILFGVGYGIFGGANLLGTTSFGRSLWYFQGTRMLLQGAWMQGGLAAVLLLFVSCFWFLKRRSLLASSNMRRFHTFLLVVLSSAWVYNEGVFDRPFAMISGFMIIWIGLGGLDRAANEEEASQPELESLRPATEAGAP